MYHLKNQIFCLSGLPYICISVCNSLLVILKCSHPFPIR